MADYPTSPGQDMVVIERRSLLQLLDAASNALQATINLEQIAEQGGLAPEDYERLSGELKEGRAKLIQGIQQLKRTVERLPSRLMPDGRWVGWFAPLVSALLAGRQRGCFTRRTWVKSNRRSTSARSSPASPAAGPAP
jgi:hypothetical protein